MDVSKGLGALLELKVVALGELGVELAGEGRRQVGSAWECRCDPEDRVNREKMESFLYRYYLDVP